jgi:hypothetical protein
MKRNHRKRTRPSTALAQSSHSSHDSAPQSADLLPPQRRRFPRWQPAVLCVCAVQLGAALVGRLPVDDLTRHTRHLGIALIAAMVLAPIAARPTRPWVRVLLAAALLLIALRWIGPTPRLFSFPAEKRLPRCAAFAIALIPLVAWLAEYLDNPDEKTGIRSALRLGIYLPIATAAAAIVVVSVDYQLLSLLDFYIPFGDTPIRIADLVFPALVAFCAWSAADAALDASQRPDRARAMHVAVAALLVIVGPVWWTVRPPLAARALEPLLHGHSPDIFSPYQAAQVLANHGDASDIDLLWDLVAAANANTGPRDPTESLTWRSYLINLLAQRDRPDTAARLSQIFRAQPSPAMAADAASVLADEHRYETAPLLVRYALWSWPDDPPLERRCAAALEQMRVPQAAAVILRDSGPAGGMPAMPTESIRLRLSRVLGSDVSSFPLPGSADADQLTWLHTQFTAAAAKGANPLSQPQQIEADQTVDAMYQYWAAQDLAQRDGVNLREQIDFDSPDTAVFAAQVKDYADRVAAAAAAATRHSSH